MDAAYEHRTDIRALMAANALYGRAFQRRQIARPCTLPATGPALVAANHTAGLDPIAIQSTAPRPIVWIMTREYYDLPALQWFMKYVEMIPIDRGGRDSRAWRDAMRMLKAGRVVGVFPEGRIETKRELLPFQTGVALLAKRGGADLYPVYLDGLQRNQEMLPVYLTPQHPSVAWGDPIRVTSGNGARAGLQALTDDLQASVAALAEQYPAPRRSGTTMLR